MDAPAADKAPIKRGMMNRTFFCHDICNRTTIIMGTAKSIQSKIEWRKQRAYATGYRFGKHLMFGEALPNVMRLKIVAAGVQETVFQIIARMKYIRIIKRRFGEPISKSSMLRL